MRLRLEDARAKSGLMKSWLNPFDSLGGELIASHGEARLVKHLSETGKYFVLTGGSEAERAELEKWIAKFMQGETIERNS